ncbi:leucyl aminopeptidase [Thermaerobacter sp. FW80]|uniref:leucyl aminopeptidase n=1 Tax=Thermaerobacter sp. FW80 TaxID=2546351 RepID=UPI001075040F|nr:leucyl aminopeptidase [Thermaerobacter sp. FW80]QBS37884.1 leucyl aminopeptidase [Thermaerobacter sp. FW80]
MARAGVELPTVAFRVASVTEVDADAVVVNLFEGVRVPGGATGAVDQALGGAIRDAIAAGALRGRLGEALVLPTLGRLPARWVIVAGLGPREGFGRAAARTASAAALRAARRHGCREVATIAHGAGIGGLAPQLAALATVEGALLGLYRYRRERSPGRRAPGAAPGDGAAGTPAEAGAPGLLGAAVDPTGRRGGEPLGSGSAQDPTDERGVERLWLIDRTDAQQAALERGLEEGRVVAEAVMVARQLGNRPANDLTPARLAAAALELEDLPGIQVTVLDEDALRQQGFGAILAVGQGSAQPPRLVAIDYVGPGRDASEPPDAAFIGKGVTFDTGGISLKPREGMEDMKFDMMGAAAVIGALHAVSRLRLPARLLGVVAAVENMPGGRAFKPGDVITTYDGTTVEVNNTDAEGRLILADAMAYARQRGARRLVDLATLTGAMVIALGDHVAGLFANDDAWAARVLRAADAAGEPLWRLPLVAAYRRRLRSEYADLRNTGGRAAGSILAALFLATFAGETPWAHLDIAGVAWSDQVEGDHGKGATGYGVRTLVELARNLAAGGRS